MYQVYPSCVGHKRSRDSRVRNSISRKEPGHEVDGGDSHSHSEENAGEDTFRAAFAERESQTGYDDCNERKAACDCAGEGLLEDAHGVLPRRGASGLREGRHGKKKTKSCRDQETGTGSERPKTVAPILRHSFSIQLRKMPDGHTGEGRLSAFSSTGKKGYRRCGGLLFTPHGPEWTRGTVGALAP